MGLEFTRDAASLPHRQTDRRSENVDAADRPIRFVSRGMACPEAGFGIPC